MRKLLLISTALIGFAVIPDRADAAPVGVWVATSLLGAGAAATAGFAIVSGVVQMALSVGLSMAVQALRGKPKQETQRAELVVPTSLPAYRHVYGKTWAPGTPVGWKVRGRSLYICYLLNSRPSAGPFTVYLDKRKVELTGDAFDFNGGGANGTNWPFGPGASGPHVWIWIGRETKGSAPTISWPTPAVIFRRAMRGAGGRCSGRVSVLVAMTTGQSAGRHPRPS
ncbi:hypothetical protein QWZ10_06940 [Paracoccus cavernae]|uniref:DUF1214 domain-containing protein n=1 Tax=Paracoccus cavernae TaxID=1571207 RepID=A0ABT8D8P5_9RHOB|nr:hypothetical protein [Paracoccus cavernae]